jgi:hypothetical protein
VLKKRGIMGKSQETQQLAVGMSRKCGFGSYRPHYGFFLGRTPQQAAGFFTCRILVYKGWKQSFHPIYTMLFYGQICFSTSSNNHVDFSSQASLNAIRAIVWQEKAQC